MQLIMKYSNRKLYNKTKSCYITLEDIKNYVLRGENFEVHDKKTGEDLTREVLASTVAELVILRNKNNSTSLKNMIIDAF